MFRFILSMKAILISYTTKGLSKTESSKLSKGLVGYTDRSNRGNYTYKRKGLIVSIGGIIISRSTFIVPKNKAKEIMSHIKKRDGSVSYWEINIPRKYFKD